MLTILFAPAQSGPSAMPNSTRSTSRLAKPTATAVSPQKIDHSPTARGVEDGPTLIFDAVGHPSILEEAVRLAAPAGRIGLLGFSSTPSAIAQQELTKKELTLCASRLNCAMFPTVIDWLERGLVTPESIITHKVDFREVSSAFELAEHNPRETCKVLLDFGA